MKDGSRGTHPWREAQKSPRKSGQTVNHDHKAEQKLSPLGICVISEVGRC